MTNAHKMTTRRLLNTVLLTVGSTLASSNIASSDVLIDAGEAVEGVVTDIRYAGENNFMGRPVAGYRAAKCWLSRGDLCAIKSTASRQSPRSGDIDLRLLSTTTRGG